LARKNPWEFEKLLTLATPGAEVFYTAQTVCH